MEPLVQITYTPTIAVVKADQQWKSLQELIEYAKQYPGKIKYGHPGLGSGNHVAGEMLGLKTETQMVQVPFRGDSEALAALLGGHIQLIFTTPPAMKEQIKSGQLKVLGQGIAVPKGIPDSDKKRLEEGLSGMIQDPEFISSMQSLGMTVNYLGGKDFTQKWLARVDNEQ